MDVTRSADEPRGAGQLHFDPDTYIDMVRHEVPAYDELQEVAAEQTEGLDVTAILELGVGTGETTVRVLALHTGASLVGVDESEAMLAHARRRLPGADLRVARLEDPLPDVTFDLVVSSLAVHHLDATGKADLFRRVAERLRPGGRFVLADLVVPDDPADAVTPIDGEFDTPSSVHDQLRWLRDAGFDARSAWERGDLAVFVADRPA